MQTGGGDKVKAPCFKFAHDHFTLEDFVRRLAIATTYNSRDTGEVISVYWKTEAEDWVKELDAVKEGTHE
jgi:hypothetical protein